MEQIKNLLANINPTVLYVLAAIVIILIIVSIIKKAVKVVTFLVIIAVAFLVLAPASSSIHEKFNVKTSDGAIVITVNGDEHTIADVKDIKNVSLSQVDEDTINLVIVHSNETIDVELPKFLKGTVEKGLNAFDIEFDTFEN